MIQSVTCCLSPATRHLLRAPRHQAPVIWHPLPATRHPRYPWKRAAVLRLGDICSNWWHCWRRPGVRFSKDPKTSRARKRPRKVPEKSFECFSKRPQSAWKISSPRNTLFFPVNYGCSYLPKSFLGSAFLFLLKKMASADIYFQGQNKS